jgi:hypothetical protein
MDAMRTLWEDINYMLDTTNMCCADIAYELECPVDWVNDVVEQRWKERVVKSEPMSPYVTCNS